MDRPPPKGDDKSRPLYERQLEEILQGAERTQQRQAFWDRLRNGPARPDPRRKPRTSLPYSRLILIALGIAVLGMLVRSVVPSVGGLLILVGVILFISPLILSIGRPGAGSGEGPLGEEKLWRGRPVIYGDDPWGATRTRLDGVVRWFRGGKPGPPPRR